MASWLMRLKYATQKCSLYSFFLVRTHMEQHQGQLPPIGKLVWTLNRMMQYEKSYMTSLKPSVVGDESMKPTIRGMKDEWVLCRLLMPPPWLTVSVGDVVGFLVDPARVSAASAAASPASPAASASPASASASASPAASATPFPVIFRQVAAIPGDEMVSSQPSDEPFRIEKKQFWVLADSPAVPAKEALDSRTLGPVHVRDMVGRALYVVRSALDHEPIHNSDQAMLDDSAVMAMECNIEDLLKRINE